MLNRSHRIFYIVSLCLHLACVISGQSDTSLIIKLSTCWLIRRSDRCHLLSSILSVQSRIFSRQTSHSTAQTVSLLTRLDIVVVRILNSVANIRSDNMYRNMRHRIELFRQVLWHPNTWINLKYFGGNIYTSSYLETGFEINIRLKRYTWNYTHILTWQMNTVAYEHK